MVKINSYRKKTIENRQVAEGLNFLSNVGFTLYINHDGLYELDTKVGVWVLKIHGTNGYHRQDVAMSKNHIFFVEDDVIYSVSLFDQTKKRQRIGKIDYNPSLLAVSHNEDLIAYHKYSDSMFEKSAVVILNMKNGIEKIVFQERVDSIAWGLDDTSLFLETYEGILIVNLTTKDSSLCIDKGSLPKALTENHIGYYKREKGFVVFCKRNLITNEETVLTKIPRRGFQSAAWDTTGKLIAISQITNVRTISFDWGSKISIWDNESEKIYNLPSFKNVSEAIFLVDDRICKSLPDSE